MTMAQRKLQQEVDKCFKKVSEGIQAFEGIFDKIQQSSNASQKEKLEDALKREIKKLQRQRDQIKTWITSNDIKDKKPLLEQRKLIETQMEKFKAVEKEMKTKAYSKEGLSAAAKLDPKEKEKLEACQFLSSMVEDLERQIETLEAESESLSATVKKGKKDTYKAERLGQIDEHTERHKWHQGKLELILRALENGSLEVDQVTALEDGIRYYVESNSEPGFMEDDAIYDELNLDEEEDAFGMNNDNDHISSQDAQSAHGDAVSEAVGKAKGPETSHGVARRPSTHGKSPLPALATLHTPLANITNTNPTTQMKPAPLPTRAPGETLKYASAAAAAAASSDKAGVGIAPLPPPPGAITGATSSPSTAAASLAPLPSASVEAKSSASTSPNIAVASPLTTNVPVAAAKVSEENSKSETLPPVKPPAPISISSDPATTTTSGSRAISTTEAPTSNGTHPLPLSTTANITDESIYHLPPGLQDLVQPFEAAKSRHLVPSSVEASRLHTISHAHAPEGIDAEKPRNNRPLNRYATPPYYPQESAPIFDDPRLYQRIDTDTLFYVFYYRQNTYQQYLAAKALKGQSWRFHKQYQTWFQRHEEPKTITEEFEQGTYRFFDYESTWMNRRKPEFKFAYKFLEDDL